MKSSTLGAALLSLLLVPIPLAGQRPQDTGPSRAGLALRAAPIEAMAPAVQAAPDALEALETYNLAGNLPTQNGFSRPLVNARKVRLSTSDLLRPTPFPLAGGVVTRSERGALVWSGEVRVEEAHALRLHLADVSLPPGTRAWTYGPSGETSDLSRRLPANRPGGLEARPASLWTGIVDGESLWLEVEVPATALRPGAEARFTLDRVLELVRIDPRGRPVLGPGLRPKEDDPEAACFVDPACAQEDFPEQVRRTEGAAARIFFVRDGGGFLCSGGLVRDTDPNTDRPLFLTANHCVHNAEVAETVVAVFGGGPAACGSSAREEEQDVDGATFLATVEETDGTLIELAGMPPNARPLPYDPDPAGSADGVIVNDSSYPGFFGHSFSRHQIMAACVHDENFFNTTRLYGGVQAGSSGSLAVTDDGRVIGQLRGACSSGGEGGICTNPQFYAFFGRASTQFPAFAPFIDPPDAGFFESRVFPDFAFKVRIGEGSGARLGRREEACLPETECVSGALPGRSEVFLRVVGPRPNGKLWPTLVKFTPSRVEVTVRQLSSGDEKQYVLDGASPGVDELPGLFDRNGFDP